jgi:hypothetical protein
MTEVILHSPIYSSRGILDILHIMKGISYYLCVDVSVILLLIKMNIFLTQVTLFFILDPRFMGNLCRPDNVCSFPEGKK